MRKKKRMSTQARFYLLLTLTCSSKNETVLSLLGELAR